MGPTRPRRSDSTPNRSTSGAEIWRITQDDYDRRARELKERRTEIELPIDQHQAGEGDYRTTLEALISVASRYSIDRHFPNHPEWIASFAQHLERRRPMPAYLVYVCQEVLDRAKLEAYW